MKVLIADDEPALRQQLVSNINQLWPEANIVAIAEDGQQALALAQQHRPDVAFLDIRMPGMSGMEVAKSLGNQCRIVFVTAYNQYAVEAFERNAIDYLLKPYTEDRLTQAIKKITSTRATNAFDPDLIEKIMGAMNQRKNTESTKLQWIRASIGDDVSMVHVEDIAFFRSSEKYTSVNTRDKEYVIRTSLQEIEQQLDPQLFWRVHRSIIVNVDFIAKAKRTYDGRYELTLKDIKEQLPVSRAYAHLFKQM